MPGCKASEHVPGKRADRDAIWEATSDYVIEHGIEPFDWDAVPPWKRR